MTNSIESLRSFALAHNEIEFAHLCTAALEGEEWAVERVTELLGVLETMLRVTREPMCADDLEVLVRIADTSRPDGVNTHGWVS